MGDARNIVGTRVATGMEGQLGGLGDRGNHQNGLKSPRIELVPFVTGTRRHLAVTVTQQVPPSEPQNRPPKWDYFAQFEPFFAPFRSCVCRW